MGNVKRSQKICAGGTVAVGILDMQPRAAIAGHALIHVALDWGADVYARPAVI